jgi:hypothetical protein
MRQPAATVVTSPCATVPAICALTAAPPQVAANTYLYTGDSLNGKKYKDIELGMLKSIIRGNHGRSCDAMWEVAQVYEEYFVFDMIGAKLSKQTLTQCDGRICDKMDVETEEGEEKTYYFDVTDKLVQQEKELAK